MLGINLHAENGIWTERNACASGNFKLIAMLKNNFVFL